MPEQQQAEAGSDGAPGGGGDAAGDAAEVAAGAEMQAADVLPLLPPWFAAVWNAADDEPFGSESAYFDALRSSFLCTHQRGEVTRVLGEALFGHGGTPQGWAARSAPRVRMPPDLRQRGPLLVRLLSAMGAALDARRERRLALTAPAPRAERLCRKLGLAAVERALLESLLVAAVEDRNPWQRRMLGAGDGAAGLTCLQLCDVAGGLAHVSLVESFLSKGRRHVKESVIVAPAALTSGDGAWLHETVRLHGSVIPILLGLHPTPQQFLGLASPTLAEVVSEEPGFDATPAGRARQIGDAKPASGGDVTDKILAARDELEAKGVCREDQVFRMLKTLDVPNASRWQAPPGKQDPEAKSDMGDGPPKEGDAGPKGLDLGPKSASGATSPTAADAADAAAAAADGDDEDEPTRYESDLQYLQDQFDLLQVLTTIKRLERQMDSHAARAEEDDDGDDDEHSHRPPWMQRQKPKKGRTEAQLRKAKARQRQVTGRVTSRLQLTRSHGPWLPRLENLVSVLTLCEFERFILVAIIGNKIAPTMRAMLERVGTHQDMYGMNVHSRSKSLTVEKLLLAFCGSLQEQIAYRRYFYRSSTLIKEGILTLHGDDFAGDLTVCAIEMDRRMLDFIVGLDTEFSEIVDGSHLYNSEVSVEDVVIPEATKNVVMDTVRHFDAYKSTTQKLQIDKKVPYGRGIVLLFYGPPGTGKTMFANALANMMKKKVLLINFPHLGSNEAGEIVKLIFREAKIHDALLFFDECESIFKSRERDPASRVNTLLTELERFDGLCILATNRAADLDEAMHRRITLSIEFRKPDHLLRARIWQALQPPELKVADDLDLDELALRFELTGGYIKNAWLSAVSLAVARVQGADPTITQQDLRNGASHQLKGRLAMADFERRVVPSAGIEALQVQDSVAEALNAIVHHGKAQAILLGQWGFNKMQGNTKGVSALFYGPPGTGKTLASSCIGYELGQPLKVVNCAQLVSKWVGESGKNIEAVFREAEALDAVLVFDEAEGLFGSRQSDGGSDGASRHDTLNVGILLHHLETFTGICIIITNLRSAIDAAFFRRFSHAVEFPAPDAVMRERLWRAMIPKECPVADAVDLAALARNYPLSGGGIKQALLRAARLAALKPAGQRVLTHEALRASCDEEQRKDGASAAPEGFYT